MVKHVSTPRGVRMLVVCKFQDPGGWACSEEDEDEEEQFFAEIATSLEKLCYRMVVELQLAVYDVRKPIVRVPMFYTCRKRLMKMVRLSPKNRTIWWRVDLPGQKGNEVGLQRDVIIQQRNGKRNVVRIGCRTCRWSSRKKENQVSIKTANPAVTTHFVPGRTNVRPIVLQPLGQFSIFYTRRKCLMKAVRLSLKSYDLVDI